MIKVWVVVLLFGFVSLGIASTPSCADTISALIYDTSAKHYYCVDLYEEALEVQRADGTWQLRPPYGPLNQTEVVRAVVAAKFPPVGYLSGQDATVACGNAGKRLCTSPEWLLACQGPTGCTYPYCGSFIEGACNIVYDVPPFYHPVCNLYDTCDGVWDSAHMNNPDINQQPYTVAPGGNFSQCKSTYGAYDMHGNLHEWVAKDNPQSTNGAFRGGFYADGTINGQGCLYVTTAHSFDYHDYSTGFRCCSDPVFAA
eukprot:TRINITY_DN18688_c0_g1_i1.p1 TRINITY_DN18688_c0_g1~~TRINITY_DN18688_c0_g1_i1.p1  ORF type:complete len:268 (+),score=77.98 TRINITY_DN18688_c0_g1_i1:37-804(+)